jgi:class 3 adenylate cyclase
MTPDTAKMNRFTLAFDDAGLEREFLDASVETTRRLMRAVWLVVFVAVPAVGLVDANTQVGREIQITRLAICEPAVLIGLATTFLPPTTFRRVGSFANGLSVSMFLALVPLQNLTLEVWPPTWAPADDLVTLISFGLAAQVIIMFSALTSSSLRFRQVAPIAALAMSAYLCMVPRIATKLGHASFAGIAAAVLPTALVLGIVASYQLESSRRRLFLEHRQLAEERAKSEALLRNVLPTAIAERLKSDPSHIADGFTEVTILFADIVGFTDLCTRLSPAEVVAMLNRLFTEFDNLAERHGLEKIKTIGDAYMVVGGLPEPREDHAEAVIAMALGMRDAVDAVAKATGYDLKVRIGVSSGPVVAGVIGKKKFAYDLWGDAVNTASRMESHGLAGEIQVTESTWARVKGAFNVDPRGTITVKGKGELPTWFVRGPRVAETSARPA